jgi:hypothetical protein
MSTIASMGWADFAGSGLLPGPPHPIMRTPQATPTTTRLIDSSDRRFEL